MAEMAMIPSKEAKEMLYSLLAENFVTLQVIIPPSFLLLSESGGGGCILTTQLPVTLSLGATFVLIHTGDP